MKSYFFFSHVEPELAQFFFVDTTPFELGYWTNPGDHVYDWREVAPRREYISNLLKVTTTIV